MEETPDTFCHHSSRYSEEAFQKMTLYRNENKFTDIILVAGNKRIPAHKVIISALCNYFHAMFSNELQETHQNVVTINDVDPDALEALVDYAYTAKLEICVDNVESLLSSACLLQVDDVKDACCEFMKSQLHPSNCLGIRAFADAHGCDQLYEIANSYTKNNFKDISKNQEFFLLNADQLREILASDDLNVAKEEEVFYAMLSWVKFDEEKRKGLLGEVLPGVRLSLLSPVFLVNEVEPAIKEDNKCKDMLLETLKYRLIPEHKCEPQLLNHKARQGTIGVIYAVGGMLFFFVLLYGFVGIIAKFVVPKKGSQHSLISCYFMK